MAEFIMRDLVKKAGVEEQVLCASAATSSEEIIYDIGNPMYPAAKAELKRRGIPCGEKRAVLLKRADYANYDYLICMEQRNLRDAARILGKDPEKKLRLLLSFAEKAGEKAEIADPWYTRQLCDLRRSDYGGLRGFTAGARRSGRKTDCGGKHSVLK